jgi:hypothetical protein
MNQVRTVRLRNHKYLARYDDLELTTAGAFRRFAMVN